LNVKALLVLFVWLVAAAAIVPRVDAYNHSFLSQNPEFDVPVLMRMLGEGRSILSNLSILQADRYFHGGVGHEDERHQGSLSILENETADEDYSPVVKSKSKVSPYNILFRIPEETEVTEHAHLNGDQLKEIVPWLYYASEIDPHNVRACTLTGFYIADKMGKVDEGIAYLRKALRNNPESWEISAELGRIYYQHEKNYTEAERFLYRAWLLLEKTPHDKFQERYVLTLLAACYEKQGRTKEAMKLYEHIQELFPDAAPVRERIKKLSSK